VAPSIVASPTGLREWNERWTTRSDHDPVVADPVIACLIVACGALGWISSAAAQGMQTWSGPKTPVKLGVTGRPDSAFLMLALHRGYFDQHGIQIETVTGGSGNEFVAPLAQDRIQAASGSLNAALFNALNRGVDIRIVADFAHLGGESDGLASIMARADLMDAGAIRSPADLKGREISLGFGRGHYSYLMARTMLAKANLTFSDVTLWNMSTPDSLAAMSNRVIDASFVIEPLVTAALRQNIARILVKGGAVEPGAQLAVLVFSPEFAKQTDAATRFLMAYLRGARDYHDAFVAGKDQDAAIAILTKALPVRDPAIWKSAMPQQIDLNGRVNVADIKRQAVAYKELGDVSGPVPDIDKYVDHRFAEDAVKIIGVR
jgi:NitT/TauT family transport system substrate-binding protein